ncbi:MAG: hypothetical protein Q9M17_08240 [Mariprofundus sp.]|nr:hypothetical protein [Mariprofundus sp.]
MQKVERSRTMLKRIVMVAVVAMALAYLFSDTLMMIYFSNQQTSVGYVLNAMILVLFLFGMFRTVAILNSYRQEEEAFSQFQSNKEFGLNHLLDGVSPTSIIANRVQVMHEMCAKKASIPHQAIASALLAEESTRTTTLRFLHNILILCGVLGTIISLSIALLGAGDMLGDVSGGGMGLVIHGMSTALSTTMSAILCYLVLAYFLAAIQSIQTRFLGRIEDATSTFLLPVYQFKEESVSQHTADVLAQAQQLLMTINEKISLLNFSEMQEGLQQERMHANQLHQQATAQMQLHHDASMAQAQQEHETFKAQLAELTAIMKAGFRL